MSIESRRLGNTDLSASVVGLGAGGNSRLGLSAGQTMEHAAQVVQAALDAGVTLVDTARVYQTEHAVGMALKGRRRQEVVLSSKSPYLDRNRQLLTPDAFAANIDASLCEMAVEMIDIYFIHGLTHPYYAACRELYLPVLAKARQAGKIRYFGLTEAFETDTRHVMLQRAVQDDGWDVIMVGFNILNPSARERILALTRQKGIGTLGMFAVRRALIDENWLRILLQRLAETGEIETEFASATDLMHSMGLRGVSETLSEAAYRFCAYEPGLDVVLSGTGNSTHLRENLAAVQRGPLPHSSLVRLEQLFGKIDSISGQVR